MFPLMQLLILPVKVVVHPALAPPESHVLAGLELEFNEGFGEKLSRQYRLALELKALGVGLDVDIFNLGELIIKEFGQVETWG